MRRIQILISLCALVVLGSSVSGCNSMRRRVARKMGVRMKRHTIKTADLGAPYRALTNTHNDFFNPNRRVTQKTGRRAIVVSYRTVGLNSLDVTLRDANLTFAQYRFADAIVDQIHKDLKSIFSLDFLRTNEREIERAVRSRSIDNVRMVRRLRRSKQTLAFVIRGMRDIATKVNQLKESVQALKTTGVSELRRNPRKAILAPELLKEAGTALKRLARVAQGSPALLTKLARLHKVFTFISF